MSTAALVRPIADLLAKLPVDTRPLFAAAFQVVDDMTMEYHDTKAHPFSSVDEHLGYCKGPAADFVRAHVTKQGIRGGELMDAGVPAIVLEAVELTGHDALAWSAAAIEADGIRLLAFVPQGLILDLADPVCLYRT
jgi:hypothetical protein